MLSIFYTQKLKETSLQKTIVSFTVALLTTAKTWKQPKGPPMDEWIKMWYIYTMDYYSFPYCLYSYI